MPGKYCYLDSGCDMLCMGVAASSSGEAVFEVLQEYAGLSKP